MTPTEARTATELHHDYLRLLMRQAEASTDASLLDRIERNLQEYRWAAERWGEVVDTPAIAGVVEVREEPPTPMPLLEAPKPEPEEPRDEHARRETAVDLADQVASGRGGWPPVHHDLPIPGWSDARTMVEQGRLLRAWRLREGLSMRKAAARLGVVYHWFNNREGCAHTADKLAGGAGSAGQTGRPADAAHANKAGQSGSESSAATSYAVEYLGEFAIKADRSLDARPPSPRTTLPVLPALTPVDVGSPLAPIPDGFVPPLRKTPVTPGDYYIDWNLGEPKDEDSGPTSFAHFLTWWTKWAGKGLPTKADWEDHVFWERQWASEPRKAGAA